jgi:hypothetical protein
MDRHREAVAELREAGVTWLVVTGMTTARTATLEFIESFSENPL